MEAVSKSRMIVRTLTLLMALTLGLSACGDDTTAEGESAASEGGGETEDTIELRFASMLAEDNAHSRLAAWFLDELEERSDGRVEVERFWLESLCASTELVGCAQDGRADIVYSTGLYHPADFPVSGSLVSLPFATENVPALMSAWLDLYAENETLRQEHSDQGLVPLQFIPSAPATLVGQEPMESVEAFEGKSYRAQGYFAQAVEMVGAQPRQVSVPEAYESVQHGTIDGVLQSLDTAVVDMNLHEITSHWYNPGIGTYLLLNTWISQESYDALPSDIQDLVMEINEEAVDRFVEIHHESNEAACDRALEAGIEFAQWSDEAKQEWRDIAQEPTREAWVSDMDEAGLDGQALLDEYLESIDQYEAEYSDFRSGLDVCIERADS